VLEQLGRKGCRCERLQEIERIGKMEDGMVREMNK